jgi:hypothetical protein
MLFKILLVNNLRHSIVYNNICEDEAHGKFGRCGSSASKSDFSSPQNSIVIPNENIEKIQSIMLSRPNLASA